MTAQGKNVKQQHLVNQGHIFIYDKTFLQGDENAALDAPEEVEVPNISEPPSTLEDENSLKAWQGLFKARRAWALEAADIVTSHTTKTAELSELCENIDRSMNVALDNLRSNVGSLQSLFEKTRTWAQDSLQEQADMLREWSAMAQGLKELPIRDDIGRLMYNPSINTAPPDVSGTMYSLLHPATLEQAGTTLEASSKAFGAQAEDLSSAMTQLNSDAEHAMSLVRIEWPNLETESLLQEAETIAKKIAADYEDVLRASPDTKSLPKVSRLAAGHTNSLLPSLGEVAEDSRQIYESARAHHQTLSKLCSRVLREISKAQSSLAGLQHQVSTLSLDEDGQNSLETLDRVFRMPSAYGAILIEAIRRSEWNDQTVAELKSLKDELSQHKDDELRRRKKWSNSMSGFLNDETASTNAISDFTFSTPANPWPFVSREEIFAYIDDLRALEINDAVEQVTQGLRELDSPAKPRAPRPRPFKNGSVHDMRESSFLNSGENNTRALQNDKLRLEDKLRASDSRIRRLEDILHRQSQSTRPSSGMFTPVTDFEKQPSSPVPTSARPSDLSSRRSSVSARRLSNQTPDEKAMVQRIISLEAQITKLQHEAHAERRSSTEHREKMQEAESVKRDLLANLESQRQEFDDERQRLEDENHEMKLRLEEVEEELDRVLGSRDHERMKQDQSISHFRSELERVRKTANEELDQLRNTKEKVERDLASQKEKFSNIDQQLHQLREERSHLQTRNMSLANGLRSMESQHQDLVGTLQSAHAHLSPAGSAPDDVTRLANALEVLAEGAAFHARGLDDALQLATAQGKESEEKIASLEAQLRKAQSIRSEQERLITGQNDQLREAHHSISTIRQELSDEKVEVERLRAQFAAGETGSDTLKARLAEEERKVEELLNSRSKSEAHIDNLQQNLKGLRQEVQDLTQANEIARLRLEGREKKAKDLSQRLFQHNDRMIRMLENFGYSVTRQGEGLLIQRASRVNASTILGHDVGTPMKRTVSGSAPAQHFSDTADIETMYWTTEEGSELEDARYEAFISALSRLDIDTTIEMITKRYKDVETIAKKYQKDSRLQRDKTHRLQSEAHDKIAYRGFKEGDLALFLPTRNQVTKPWAAFNVGAPHYFLREQDAHKLQTRDWLLARINKIEERVVDLSRSMETTRDRASVNAEASDGASTRSYDDNPFELSDGLRWYLIDAAEERPGAPSTPGLGKTTVAASVVDVKAQIGRKSSGGRDPGGAVPSAVNATKTLHKSLDSRRSSETSRKSAGPLLRTSALNNFPITSLTTAGTDGEAEGQISPVGPLVRPSDADIRAQSQGQAREDAKIFDVVRQDLMLGP